jgi:hypothetical protein
MPREPNLTGIIRGTRAHNVSCGATEFHARTDCDRHPEKMLTRDELPDHDQPGFLERYGYHNDADYSKEECYGFSGVRYRP